MTGRLLESMVFENVVQHKEGERYYAKYIFYMFDAFLSYENEHYLNPGRTDRKNVGNKTSKQLYIYINRNNHN